MEVDDDMQMEEDPAPVDLPMSTDEEEESGGVEKMPDDAMASDSPANPDVEFPEVPKITGEGPLEMEAEALVAPDVMNDKTSELTATGEDADVVTSAAGEEVAVEVDPEASKDPEVLGTAVVPGKRSLIVETEGREPDSGSIEADPRENPDVGNAGNADLPQKPLSEESSTHEGPSPSTKDVSSTSGDVQIDKAEDSQQADQDDPLEQRASTTTQLSQSADSNRASSDDDSRDLANASVPSNTVDQNDGKASVDQPKSLALELSEAFSLLEQPEPDDSNSAGAAPKDNSVGVADQEEAEDSPAPDHISVDGSSSGAEVEIPDHVSLDSDSDPDDPPAVDSGKDKTDDVSLQDHTKPIDENEVSSSATENQEGKYQMLHISKCCNCHSVVASSSMGKYSVRFGHEVKQFCTPPCLDSYKKSIKTCSYCQKNLQDSSDGFLAAVGGKDQFRDFCSQECLDKYDCICNNTSASYSVATCVVCDNDKVAQYELLSGNQVAKLCTDICLAAYKFVNKIEVDNKAGESGETQKIFVPVPVPIYVPYPAAMYSLPSPVLLPIPVPFAVPIIVPTSLENMDQVIDTMKEILNKESGSVSTAQPSKSISSDGESQEALEHSSAESNKSVKKSIKRKTRSFDEENILDEEAEQPKKARFSSEESRTHSTVTTKKRLNFTLGVEAWKYFVKRWNASLQNDSEGGKTQLKIDLLSMSRQELNDALTVFVQEAKRPNGLKYRPDCTFYLCLGIQHYLFQNERADEIFCDDAFSDFTNALDVEAKSFHSGPKPPVSRVEEEHLWESAQLGAKSPQLLLMTIMYFFTLYFELWTVEQHLQLTVKNFSIERFDDESCTRKLIKLKLDGEGSDSAKPREYELKENENDRERCPVRFFEFYLSKCPMSSDMENDPLYLMPISACDPNNSVWFMSMPLPEALIQKMVNRVKMIKEVCDAINSSTAEVTPSLAE
ncbi:unnamed protein product [Nesidiocoris tenuis]|uniref:TRASH domain-containing protein n=1 Tax=Nesidiocoris tenuis TaxID=355587 RepID=A0A6H5GYA6_9HEMI|nr:unnamed protein product [Nesidiocoris tenuis]